MENTSADFGQIRPSHLWTKSRPTLVGPDGITGKVDDIYRTSFRSVWALEVPLLLKREGHTLTTEELVATLRASIAVVNQALASLVAGGLATSDGRSAAYQPVTLDLAELVDAAERSYASRPDQVRRIIIAAAYPSLIAFSDAFRLKD